MMRSGRIGMLQANREPRLYEKGGKYRLGNILGVFGTLYYQTIGSEV